MQKNVSLLEGVHETWLLGYLVADGGLVDAEFSVLLVKIEAYLVVVRSW